MKLVANSLLAMAGLTWAMLETNSAHSAGPTHRSAPSSRTSSSSYRSAPSFHPSSSYRPMPSRGPAPARVPPAYHSSARPPSSHSTVHRTPSWHGHTPSQHAGGQPIRPHTVHHGSHPGYSGHVHRTSAVRHASTAHTIRHAGLSSARVERMVRSTSAPLNLRRRIAPAVARLTPGRPLTGLRVDSLDDGPGLQAGLQPGDVILSYDGNPVSTFESLRGAIQANDGPAELVYLDGETGEPRSMVITPENGMLGAAIDAENPIMLGLEILQVHEGPAAQAGLRERDVILSCAGVATPTAEDLQDILRSTSGGIEVVYIDGETGEEAQLTVYPQDGFLGLTVEAVHVG
jgi:PDZ domain